MKFDSQTQNHMPNSKNSKLEVPNVNHVTTTAAILENRQTLYLRGLWTDLKHMTILKNPKPEVLDPPPSWKSKHADSPLFMSRFRYKLTSRRRNTCRFRESENRKHSTRRQLENRKTLYLRGLWTDFDENWYSLANTPAEFENFQAGCTGLNPWSKKCKRVSYRLFIHQ